MLRTARPAQDLATEADLVAIAEPIRRSVRRRIATSGRPGEADAEDIVQEALTRLWSVRWRLERSTLLPYGLVIARNLITSAQQQDQRQHRIGPRLVDPPLTGDPAADLIAAEERASLQQALERLRTKDRRLLIEHEVHGVEARKIAAEEGLAANTVAARLARARARLRVEHLLSLRRVTLPTARCRGVLDALSLGDRTRQRQLLAAEHLTRCAVCAELAEPLVSRRRSLVGLLPVAILIALPGKLWAWVRGHPWTATGASAATAAVAVAVGIFLTRQGPVPPPPRSAAQAPPAIPATLSVGGARVLPAGRVGSLAADVGDRAVARDAPVQAVPADEGFWVGAGPGRRVWVQLKTAAESSVRVRPGQHISFTGTVAAAPAGMPAQVGLSPAEGAAELRAIGAYVVVDPARLTVH